MILRRVALGLALVLAAVYVASPWLAARLLPPLLTRWGIEESRFDFGYPRWDGIDVTRFSVRSGAASIVGDRVRIVYSPRQLWRGEVESVVVDALTIGLAGDSRAYNTSAGPFELPPIWTLVPARRVNIVKLVVTNETPVVSAQGSVNFDPEVLQLHIDVESPLLAVPLQVSGAVNPDGRIALTLAERGAAAPLGSLTGVPDTDRRAMTFDAQIALTGRPLALAAAYLAATVETGNVLVQAHGRAAWPLPADAPWLALTGDGRYRIELAGSTPDVGRAQVKIDGGFSAANESITAHIDPGGAVELDIPALQRLGARADLDGRVSLTTDQDVQIDYTHDALRIGDGLIVTVSGGAKPIQFRTRGAFHDDHRFELGIVGLDGAPIVLATGVPDGAQSISIKSRIAVAGKLLRAVAGSVGVSATGGHLLADFDGALRWPPVNDAGLQNVSGKGRVKLALSGRLSPQRLFDIALEGDYLLDGGAITATLDPGAHVVLGADGIEVSTISALTIAAQSDGSHVVVGPVDFKLALPPMRLGSRTISLADAWVATARVTLDGAAVEGSAVVRSRAGRDALPVRVTMTHDLSTAKGRFSIDADWQIKKAVLATQLPGFIAPYDVDEGSLRLALTGGWDSSDEFDYHASGQVHLNASRAHYEDYLITGFAADFPVSVAGAAFAVAHTPLSIEQIDVGFPLTQISAGLAVANGVARIDALSGSVLGGSFAMDEFGYDIAADKAALDVELTSVSLADVLALEGGDVMGSGVLDGRLPVTIDGENFTIDSGHVNARPPGGTLIYKGASASSMVAQSGFGFAFLALEDFRFDTLDAKVALAPDGGLALAVALHGSNPAVEQGRAFQFNLNLTENLPALLESLRAADRITDRVEQRVVR